jgi:hypothetical protein
MVIFHSYVSLPEGNPYYDTVEGRYSQTIVKGKRGFPAHEGHQH